MFLGARILAALSSPLLLLALYVKKAPTYRGYFPKTHHWYKKRLTGCVCSDGSSYSVYFKKGTVNKTVVYFSGGGASWDTHTASLPTTVWRLLRDEENYYFPNARYYMEVGMTGLLAANDARNPINDWNVIYLPYTTADFHIGRSEFAYRQGNRNRVLYHHGEANVRAALDAAPKSFLEADQVLVGGESAGGFAAIAWTPDMADYFPRCGHFVVYADGAQMCSLKWPEILRDVWNTDAHYYECLRNDGQIVRDWFLYLHSRLGARVTCLHAMSPRDEVLSHYENRLNGGAFALDDAVLARFHENLRLSVRDLMDTIPEYRIYLYSHGRNEKTGATAHTISRTPLHFYTEKADGMTIREWLKNALDGKDVSHVGLHHLEL